MEKLIFTEVVEFLNVVQESNSKPIDLNPFLTVAVSNVICNLLMSVRFTQNDPKFKRFTFLIDEGMKLFGQIHTIDYIPCIQYLPATMSAKAHIAQNRKEMFHFYKEVLDDHRATFDPNNMRDLVDTYLFEIQKAIEEGNADDLFDGKDHGKLIARTLLIKPK